MPFSDNTLPETCSGEVGREWNDEKGKEKGKRHTRPKIRRWDGKTVNKSDSENMIRGRVAAGEGHISES
jgi:hypothetical protein